MNWSGNFREGLAREIRENKTLAKITAYTVSDRAWWGLRNFYTELWNSLMMQIYANLFKINEKCRLSSIQKSQQICTWGGDVYYASRNLLFTCLIRTHLHPCLLSSRTLSKFKTWFLVQVSLNPWKNIFNFILNNSIKTFSKKSGQPK